MKQTFTGILILTMAVLLSACGQQSPASTAGSSTGSSELSLPQVSSEQSIPDESVDAVITEESQNSDPEEKTKILIAYFTLADIVPDGVDAVSSATPSQGNTRTAAIELQAQTGGDLFQITTDREYPVSHSEASAIAENEMRADDRPVLTSQVDNIEQYDVVFVGYPLWWYTSPMAIRTFMEAYDFSGKTIVPFCTSLGAGVEQSVGEIQELCPDATVLDGLTLHTGRTEGMADSIAAWLEQINLN